MKTIHDKEKIKELIEIGSTSPEFIKPDVKVIPVDTFILALKMYAEHIRLKTIDEAIGFSDIEQLKEDAGKIPENTCPNIDKLISEHNTIVKELDYLERRASKYDSAEEIVKDFPSTWTEVENIAEQLRRDNEQLRSLGEFWYEAYKNLITNLEQLKNLADLSSHIWRNTVPGFPQPTKESVREGMENITTDLPKKGDKLFIRKKYD